MLPLRFMSLLDTHKIQINDKRTITVKVVDQAAMVSPYLTELKNLIRKSTAVGLVVGYGFDLLPPKKGYGFDVDEKKPAMLQLSVEARCLLIQLGRLDSISECLKEFLADPEICFVGVDTSSARCNLRAHCGIELRNGIDVNDLAEKVLKKSDLGKCGLGEIAAMVGVSLPKEYPGSHYDADFEAKFYTRCEITNIIHDVYAAHVIGTKLLGFLLGLGK